MAEWYLVTGAAGHLGNTVVSLLASQGKQVRALVLPGDEAAPVLSSKAQVYYGDTTLKESLTDFFSIPAGDNAYVIHAAGIVSISSRFDPKVYRVNVEGTRNIVTLCQQHGAAKLVHVSSVHAIPEQPHGSEISEVDAFDPQRVVGLYAQTKAEATQLVLDAARLGLHASVVHPSGICGPNDYGHGHLTQLLIDYCTGRLFVGIEGGYDFVDVRDVAAGVVSCCERGGRGECYILSNRYFALSELFGLFHMETGKKQIKHTLPLWFARGTAPFSEIYYRMMKQPPLFTAYSLYTLSSNARFSHKKAAQELDYHVRPMEDTIRDTILWLEEQGRI